MSAAVARVAARLRAASARLSDAAVAPIYAGKPMTEEHFVKLEAAYWLDKAAEKLEREQRR